MDFGWSPEEEEFRQRVRQVLREELPDGWLQSVGEAEDGDARSRFEAEFARNMGRRGWLTVGWPEEFGGMGWTPLQQMIFNEEMALSKAPRKHMAAGVTLSGPVIMLHGSDEQKKRFLPPIAKGEVIWCQLFSEPDAGSDLASLQTRAEEMGDFFLVNGQKTWTSQGHEAQWGLMLARTDPEAPKHKGLSYFLVDMTLPGITSRPIINMADVHHFNEFFFDNVRIPRDCLVGEKNRGWYLATTTLNFERSGIRATVPAMQLFDEIVAFAKEGRDGFRPLQANPELRHKLADMAIQLHTSRLLSYRVGWLQSSGAPPSHESSVSRLFATELTQRLVQLGMETLGLWAQPTENSSQSVLHGKVQKLYRGQRAITIGAGTSEIQRNTIAMRGLGLPRG